MYKLGGSIRLPNSFKYDWKKKQFIERYYKVSREDFMKCIVNYIDDCIIFTDSISLNIDQYYTILENKLSDVNYLNYQFKDCKFIKREDKIDVIFDESYVCPTTNILHESQNAFIKIKNEKHYLICYSKACKMSKFELQFENQNENISKPLVQK